MSTTSNTVTCSIRVNANTKKIFDVVCERIGITPSAAYNIFTNAVASEQRIPFEVKAMPVNSLPEKKSALDEMREDLEKRGLLKDYTMDEINEMIKEARNYKYSKKELKEQEEFLNELLANR